jgi:uncharacterized membrane protein
MEYSRIYIGNINEDIKQEDIMKEFERFVTVVAFTTLVLLVILFYYILMKIYIITLIVYVNLLTVCMITLCFCNVYINTTLHYCSNTTLTFHIHT